MQSHSAGSTPSNSALLALGARRCWGECLPSTQEALELESSVGQSSIMVYAYNLSTQGAGTGGSMQSVFMTCLVCMRFFLNYKAENLKASFLHVACI